MRPKTEVVEAGIKLIKDIFFCGWWALFYNDPSPTSNSI
jgi:hypothetical protein